jgi:hypothetical protein
MGRRRRTRTTMKRGGVRTKMTKKDEEDNKSLPK